MDWVSGLTVYFVLWWLVLFMVLPWGIRTIDAEDVAKGQAPSAPVQPRIVTKMLITTGITAVLWILVEGVILSGWISFRVDS
ncbi:MAG: DUF1467 family protein [Rhodobacterales bacterium]|nr:DUF1467 family protein [Rhodobacterales bacterium]